MGKGNFFLEKLAEDPDVPMDTLPGLPIVEIAGDRRVLIENHLGVKAYGYEKILVNVKFGCICVCGHGLELIRMTREQLVIKGRIEGITLQRRG